jgi:tetratricopeptide (TPR) repeat protein
MGALDEDPDVTHAVELRELGTAEAAGQLASFSDAHPANAAIAYQAAWLHDSLGLEAEAVPFYQRALAVEGSLPVSDRHGAHLGLGSTFRVLGRYQEAISTFRRGLDEFPDDAALRSFLGMALYNVGEAREAVRTLLHVIAERSADEQVQSYQRAINYYADNLDEVV